MVSISCASPILVPLRRCMAWGAWLMLSWPPATTISASPIADRLEAQGHRAQAGAAELIDAIGGLLDGNTGVDGGLAGGVLPGAGSQHLTQHDLGHFTRLDACALQRFPDRDFAQVMGGTELSEPLNAPMGVRAALAITTSVMGNAP